MTAVESERQVPVGRLKATAWAVCVLAVVGWLLAQLLPARITENQQFTSAFIHAAATSTFAVVLGLSAVINASVVTSRAPHAPPAYRGGRLGVALLTLLALVLAWVVCIAVGEILFVVEFGLGIAIAIASCVVLGFALSSDEATRARRAVRIAERTPAQARRRRVIAIAVPVGVALAITVALVGLALVPIEHRGCTLNGFGTERSGGTETHSLFTSCGTFAYDPTRLAALGDLTDAPFDVTTRGFRLVSPALVVVDVRPQ